jgi:hypothetical protein
MSAYPPLSGGLLSLWNNAVLSLNDALRYLVMNLIPIAMLFVIITFLKHLGAFLSVVVMGRKLFLVGADGVSFFSSQNVTDIRVVEKQGSTVGEDEPKYEGQQQRPRPRSSNSAPARKNR